MLLITLAAHQIGSKPCRRYWEELGQDLGVHADTVRGWARDLKRAGLLKIKHHQGPARDPSRDRPGFRNERNTFVLDPLIEVLRREIMPDRETQRQRRKRRSQQASGEKS